MLILSEIFINFDIVPHNSIMHDLNLTPKGIELQLHFNFMFNEELISLAI